MELIEGTDYYLENGRYVFKASHHLARGYCCGSRCRHCPYTQIAQNEAVKCRLEGKSFKTREQFETHLAALAQEGTLV
jgi:hypothetical protein